MRATNYCSQLTRTSGISRIFSGRKIAIVVLRNQQWPDVQLNLDRIVAAVNAAIPGSYAEVDIPHKDHER